MVGCFSINFVKLGISSAEKQCRKLGLEPRQIELDDGQTSIHCWVPLEQFHKEKPCLLLVHGFGADGLSTWANHIPEFSKHYAVYVPDLVFFGKSWTKGQQRSESFQAECLIKLLAKQEVGEAFVVGTSYGGMVTFRMAALRPDLVKKAVIASSGVCMKPDTNDPVLQEFNASHIHEVLMPDTVKTQKKTISMLFHKPPLFVPDFYIRQMMEEFGGNRDERIQLLDAIEIGKPGAGPLPKLTQPVLILWGESDRIFKLELAKELQEHLGQNAKLVIIPKAGHIPQVEKPKEFSKHILAFLAE